jgi:uncharacterized protein (TIGR02301 family)
VRTAEQRQVLIDLAYVLGQAHALHRVCAGPTDDTWRARMEKLLAVESPGEAMKARLSESFNAGFTARPASAQDCKAAIAAEQALARRGAEMARTLAAAPAP